jgi:hypothetical protein
MAPGWREMRHAGARCIRRNAAGGYRFRKKRSISLLALGPRMSA